MSNQVKEVREQKHGKLKNAVAVGVISAMATTSAFAGELDAVTAGFTAEIDGAKAVMITLFTAAAVIIGMIIGWKMLKRGANAT